MKSSQIEDIKADYLLKSEKFKNLSYKFLWSVIGFCFVTLTGIICIPYFIDIDDKKSLSNIDNRIAEYDSISNHYKTIYDAIRFNDNKNRWGNRINIENKIDSINNIANQLTVNYVNNLTNVLEIRKMINRDNYFRITKQDDEFRIKIGSKEIFFNSFKEAKELGQSIMTNYPELTDLNESLSNLYEIWKIADEELSNDTKYSNYRNANAKTRAEDSIRNLSIRYQKEYDALLENKAKIEAEKLAGNNNTNITKLLRINISRIFVIIIMLFFTKIGIQQHRYFMLMSQHYLKLHDALNLYKNGLSELDFDRLVQSLSINHNFKDVESEMDKLVEIMKK